MTLLKRRPFKKTISYARLFFLLNHYCGLSETEIKRFTPRQAGIKAREVNEFLIEKALDEYIKAGGTVADLDTGGQLYKKYMELNTADIEPAQEVKNKVIIKEAAMEYETEIKDIAKNKASLFDFFNKSEVNI